MKILGFLFLYINKNKPYEMEWNKINTEKLIELYPNKTNADLALIFNTSIKSIISKSNRLGLKKSKSHKSNMISKRNKMVGTDITYDLMLETALKYKTRGEFQRLDSSIYTTAMKGGFLNDICKHMVKSNYSIPQLILFYIIKTIFNDFKITYDDKKQISPYELDILIEDINLAFEYDGKYWHENNETDKIKDKLCLNGNIELIRIIENNRDYECDIKKQLIENINILNKYKKIEKDDIMNISTYDIYNYVNINIVDNNDIMNIIKKYKYYSDFVKFEKNLYQKLIRNKQLKLLDENLIKIRIEWNDDLVIKEVKKYEYLSDFINNSRKCYLYCKKNNKTHLLNDLKKKYKSYNLEEINYFISKYEYLIDFKNDYMNVYSYLKVNKMLSLTKSLKRYKNRDNKKYDI